MRDLEKERTGFQTELKGRSVVKRLTTTELQQCVCNRQSLALLLTAKEANQHLQTHIKI